MRPLAGVILYIYNCPMFNHRHDAGPYFIIMLVYQSFGQFTTKEIEIYSPEQHAAVYREDLPTRRRQLNAINKDIDNMRHAIATIRTQQDAGQIWSRHLGDKYGFSDLRRLERDFANLLAARLEIEQSPCPAKVAKEKAAQEAAQDEQPQPVRVTLELPAGVTLYDLYRLFDLAGDNAHARRIKAHEEFQQQASNGDHSSEEMTHLYNETQNKCNYLSDLWNASNKLSDAVRDQSWEKEPTATREQFFAKDEYLRD